MQIPAVPVKGNFLKLNPNRHVGKDPDEPERLMEAWRQEWLDDGEAPDTGPESLGLGFFFWAPVLAAIVLIIVIGVLL